MKLVLGLPEREYHASPAVSQSLLKQVERSPAHALAWLAGDREEPTPAIVMGRAIHMAVLEPARFSRAFAVVDGDRRTTAVKAAVEKATADGFEVLRGSEKFVCDSIATAVGRNPAASALMASGGSAEVSCFFEEQGLACKARADFVTADGSTLVDLKTADDASPDAFSRAVSRYGYDIQDAHYRMAFGAGRMVFVVVEKTAPFAVGIYELSRSWQLHGEQRRGRLLATWRDAVKAGVYPGYEPSIVTLDAPEWLVGGDDDD